MLKWLQFRIHAISGSLVFLFPLLLSGCTPQFFSKLDVPAGLPLVTPGSPSGSKCSDSLLTTQENLKIILMVDHSGSTEDAPPNIPADRRWHGTDIGKVFRAGAIRNFLNKYGSKKNFTYTLGFFGTETFFYDPSQKEFGSAYPPFGTADDMREGVAKFESSLSTLRGTFYQKAFNSIKEVISRDATAKNKQKYVVIFISDGEPTDFYSFQDHDGNWYPREALWCEEEPAIDEKIAALVKGLQKVAADKTGGSVSVSSIYFGDGINKTECEGYEDGEADNWWAIHHLEGMAAAGQGQFVDRNINAAIQIDDIINIPGKECSK